MSYQPNTPHILGFDFASLLNRVLALEQAAIPTNPAPPAALPATGLNTSSATSGVLAQLISIALGIQILDAPGSSNVIAAFQSGAGNNITVYQQIESNALNPNSVNGSTAKHALRIPAYGASPGSLGFDMDNGVTLMWHDVAGNTNAGKLFCDAQNNFHLQLIKTVGLTGSFGETNNGVFYIENNPASPDVMATFYPLALASEIDAQYPITFRIEGCGLCLGAAWFYGSDRKLKDNIVQIDHALDKVLQLTGVYFTWKDQKRGAGRKVGFIAQDVQPVLPEVVLDNGRDDLALSYDHVVPLLLEAIKELTGRVQVLEKQLKKSS